MKPYFKTICKLRNAALAFCVFFCAGCHPGFIVPGNIDVFVKKSVSPFYLTGTLVIVPFDCPEIKPDFGLEAARMFESEINKTGYLKNVSFVEEALWLKQIADNDLKIKKALLAARDQNANLLLWGSIEKFIPGAAGETSVTLTVRLIDIATGKVLWWGRDKAVGKPGNTFLLFGPLRSPDPPAAEKLMAHCAHRMVSAMFKGIKKQKAAAGADDRQVKETAVDSGEAKGTPGDGPPAREDEASKNEKDSIDKALDDFNVD